MLTLDAGAVAQKTCKIGPFTVGGSVGENPPLMIASMFHNGDRLLESRKERKFNRTKARDYILRQEELMNTSGVPGLVAMVANTADEMKEYIDFIIDVTDLPFGIDMWRQEERLKAAEYAAELGLQDRLLYNSITPWDKDVPGQVEALKEMGIKHVVVQVYDKEDQLATGRVKSFEKLIKDIGEDTFETILVDTSVMNLPAIAISCLANKMIKSKYGWPVGNAPSNGIYMWKEGKAIFGSDGFTGINAAGQGVAAFLWSDLIFYGPIVAAPKIYPGVLTASLMQAVYVYGETGKLPENKKHPIYKHFNDFAGKLLEGAILGK